MDKELHDMISLYQDLNSSLVDVLNSEPSPLEFMRFVARNRPFVVRRAINSWPAYQKWKSSYLEEQLANTRINVAITPHGNADAPVADPKTGEVLFVKPLEKEVSFPEFLAKVRAQGHKHNVKQPDSEDDEVWYAQTQNDNLRGEYSSLLSDVSPSIDWARIALEQDPDAVNLWIGSGRSVTALHRDNYENVYCQVLGQKHFVLIPPTEAVCVNERMLSQGVYEKLEDGKWSIKREEEADKVPCAIWDPDVEEGQERGEWSRLCRPVRVTLDPGDMLYLPALWYHKVSQSVGDDGICVAVNYWYDMDFGGSLYATSNFFRERALVQREPVVSN